MDIGLWVYVGKVGVCLNRSFVEKPGGLPVARDVVDAHRQLVRDRSVATKLSEQLRFFKLL